MAPYWRRSAADRWIDGKQHTPRALMTPCEAEGCHAFGSWGYKVNLGRGDVGHWYCFEHRHLGEALYASSTHSSDHAAEGEPHAQPPIADRTTDGA